MPSLACVTAEVNESTGCAFLIAFQQHAAAVGFSSINHRMVPDRVAAREWGMERFPDQSQLNLFLNRMTAENLAQLEHAHQELLRSHSLLRSAERW